MKILKTKLLLVILVACTFLGCKENVQPPKAVGPVPTQKQIEWQEMERYAFIHFTTNTFTNKEWGFGDESPTIFNPTQLDCRQWARIVKEAGLTGIILTAKHHDGFCLWPSKYTDHSVEQSPWKDGTGDVVRELSEACKEFDLKFGLYLSPWDRNHPEYGRDGYIKYFRNQLQELLTSYGEVFEMWFDGANGGTGYYGGANERRKINTLTYYDWDETYRLIREWSPKTLVWGIGPAEARWIGNEHGEANPTNWSPYRQKDRLAGKVHYKENMTGHEDGEKWVPGEADVSIRPGWFYHKVEDEKVKSVERLMEIYYHTVGRNATLLLNLPVDRRGLIHEIDEARLKAWAKAIKQEFQTEVLANSKASATDVRGNSKTYAAKNVLDNDKNTYWATNDSVTAASLTFEFKQPTTLNRVLLQEYIALGQRVRKFNVAAQVNGKWETIAEQTTIGYKRILKTKRVEATALRINISSSKACPLISNVKAYNAPLTIKAPSIKRDKKGLVTINAAEGEEIFYTTDGNEPTLASKKYTEPFQFSNAVVIKAIAHHKGEKNSSEASTAKYGKAKAKWSVVSVSGEQLGSANNMVDSNPQSIWTSNKKNKLPLSIVIDMGEMQTIKGFTYMPRQIGNGLNLISGYAFYTSSNKRNWKKQSEGEFSNILNNPILQRKHFSATKARYIKLVAKSQVSGGNRISIGEIGVE
ncbi:alpha-L-fucosidase [Prolixibacteraceae bacterium JC049]|nr:alpha-L-fucosidase [Prolixibacteraceae bacterium JC049]